MYRGYVICNGKAAIEKFKGVDHLHSFDEVKDEASYAGVLDGEVVMIDVDKVQEARALYEVVMGMGCQCDVLKTTRGMHFYFRYEDRMKLSCKTGVNLFCGIEADIKVGVNAYDALKVDGVEREWMHRYEDHERDVLPGWMIPGGAHLYGLTEGDGRNDLLYKMIPRLQKLGCSSLTIKKLYSCINSYVFATPLKENELAMITREEAFLPEDKIKEQVVGDASKKKKTYYDIAIGLIEKHEISVLPPFFISHDTVLSDDAFKRFAREFEPETTIHGCMEIEENVRLFAPKKKLPPSSHICFTNGVFDASSGEWVDDASQYGYLNPIPHRYNALAYSQVVDRTLDKICCYDKEVRANIEEMIGYCMLSDCRYRKGFILYGGKRNGKSSLLRAVIAMLGDTNISSLDLKDLGRQFATQILAGKLANIGDDISAEYINDVSIAKKLISGEIMTVDRKYKDSIQFRNTAKLVFSANDLTRFKDDTGAMLDRFIVIPCFAEFKDTDVDYNPMIERDITTEEALEYFVKLGVDALMRLLQKNAFTRSRKVEQVIHEYATVNNPLLEFFEIYPEGPQDGDDTQNFYNQYLEYCVRSNISPVSKIGFSRVVCKQFNLCVRPKKEGAKIVKIFAKK